MSASSHDKRPSKGERPAQMSAESWRVIEIIGLITLGVIALIFWVIYAVNPNWATYCLAVGVPLLSTLAIYRLKPNLVSEAVISTINTVVVWIVYFTHVDWIPFFVGVVMIILFLRNLLEYVRGTEREAILESFRRLEEPVKINSRLAVQLDGDERYVSVNHFHVISAVPWFLAMVAWFLLWCVAWAYTSIGTLWALGLVVGGELLLLIKPLLWRHELLCLTTRKRLFMLQGFLKQTISETSLDKITDQNMVIPRLSTVLSWLRLIKAPYGYFKAETAGQSEDKEKIENKIGPIPEIHAFKRAATQMMTPES